MTSPHPDRAGDGQDEVRLVATQERLFVRDCGVCGVPATSERFVCEGYTVPRCPAHSTHVPYQAEARLASLADRYESGITEQEATCLAIVPDDQADAVRAKLDAAFPTQKDSGNRDDQ